MKIVSSMLLATAPLLGLATSTSLVQPPTAAGPRFAISFPSARSPAPLDGRLLLLISDDPSAAVQVFYPEEFNGARIACPDPIDFRAYTVVDIYEDRNAYYLDSRWKHTPRPGRRDSLGHVSATLEEMNHRELALGSNGRSGDQWDIWQACTLRWDATAILNRSGTSAPARSITT